MSYSASAARGETEQLGDPAELRSHDGLPVDDADRRAVVGGGQRTTPPGPGIRVVGCEPDEGDLVAVEEAAQLGAVWVPAVADDERARRRRLGGEPCSPRGPLMRKLASAPTLGDDRIEGRDSVVVVRLDSHDARLNGRAEPGRMGGAERDRHLAEDVARQPLADDLLDPVDELDRLEPALEHGEEGAVVALVDGEVARRKADVRRHAREPLLLPGSSIAKTSIRAISSGVTTARIVPDPGPRPRRSGAAEKERAGTFVPALPALVPSRALGSAGELVAERELEPREGVALELADALARQAQLLADRLQ